MPTYNKACPEGSFHNVGDDWPAGIDTPTNVSISDGTAVTLYAWEDPTGNFGTPSGARQIFDQGRPCLADEQVQIGSGAVVGNAVLFFTAEPASAKTPGATLAAKHEYLGAVATDGTILAAAMITASFTVPAVSATVVVDVDDASAFAGYSAGQAVYACSMWWTIASVNAGAKTITLTNTGLGAVRVSTID
jgi:hypothetical protein